MPPRFKRPYPPEFRREAVRLVETTGRSIPLRGCAVPDTPPYAKRGMTECLREARNDRRRRRRRWGLV
jgi:hypothetical protein